MRSQTGRSGATRFRSARITARKWNGDDAYSWAVFVDGKPVYTGLTKAEVPHYKRLAEKVAQQGKPKTGERKRRKA